MENPESCWGGMCVVNPDDCGTAEKLDECEIDEWTEKLDGDGEGAGCSAYP